MFFGSSRGCHAFTLTGVPPGRVFVSMGGGGTGLGVSNPSTFLGKHMAKFGSDVPLARSGEPNEIAPCYLFLASEDSDYMTGQVLHPNGGEIING
jgi:NAD(P)-dependent dehydrogenase (short-subunit alcohol dehydrogenase family)